MPNPTESKWWMHLPLLNYPASSVLYPIINEMMSHPTQDDFRDDQNFGKSIEIPTLHLSTWHDMFCSSVLEAYKTIQERVGNQQKFFIGPGDHFAVYKPGFWPYDPFFLWFDYWLKGIHTGIMDEPPIYFYHSGSETWRYADMWPPPSIEYMQYYLHSDGVLSTNAPSSGEPSVSYVYDPRNPVVTIGGKGLYIPAGSLDQRLAEPPHRKDVLVYTSDILTKDVEIAGNVEVVLQASSSCKDTDFTAKLIDVHPDRKTMLILEGVIRAMYRESPRYPVPLEPGKLYEFSINLSEISHVFKAGHRIQVDISSSNFPRRTRNTNSGNVLYTADSEKDIVVATNSIYHDAKYPSYIILPILPLQKPSVFGGTANIKTAKVTYMGPAELYTFPTAVYLHFKDQWIKWKNLKNLRRESEVHYKCEGKTGKLSVLVQTKDQTSFDALAKGEGVYFKGGAK